MRISRYAYATVAVLFVAGIVVQVFLAGLFLFANVDRQLHREFGYDISLLPLLALLLAWPARAGRRVALLNAALVVDVFVQTSLPYLASSVPAVAALHPVNALLALWLGVKLAQAAVSLVRDVPAADAAPRTPVPSKL